jgi:glycolate oxidase
MVSITRHLLDDLIKEFGKGRVLHTKEDLLPYRSDAFTLVKGDPGLAVLPLSTKEVASIVKLCNRHKVPFLARGAGTSLSGGSIPLEDCVVIVFSKMNRIIEVDYDNSTVLAEAGATNISISAAVANGGMMYAPDPSSQQVCTIGGNISHNSGGPHTLKYGVTTNHVLAAEVVLSNGEVVEIGSKARERLGYDLLGLLNGADGTLGIVTRALMRIIPKPTNVETLLAEFDDMEHAGDACSEIIASGILPAAMELIDDLVISAVEDSIHAAGYSKMAGAILLIEVDGLKSENELHSRRITEICIRNHSTTVNRAPDEIQRQKFWAGRKGAFAAMGRLGANYIVQDGVIPRSRLAEALKNIRSIGRQFDLRIANVFHAGDGNLHPLIIFDERKGETERAIKASVETIRTCTDLGGSITGEHGVGVEKRDLIGLMFNDHDLELMRRLKEIFDPNMICNPCKVIPQGSRCLELLPRTSIQ